MGTGQIAIDNPGNLSSAKGAGSAVDSIDGVTPAQAPAASYVGRFAPSPTGPLHFGSLVTAVASYVDARAAGGQWLLRIEDVDTTRCTVAAEREIMAQLAGFGFEHDGAIVFQRERAALYEDALQRLQLAGRLYACRCTRSRLALAPRNAEGETIYPGTCRELNLPIDARTDVGVHRKRDDQARLASEASRHLALRFRVADASDPGADVSAQIEWHDRCFGAQHQSVACDVGDFVLRRADGLFAYQLAVVVDDAAQGVSDVVRGADLLGNTARQILLQRHLGLPQPRYLHVPLVRNTDGQKLSKQTNAAAIHVDGALVTLQAAWRYLGQRAIDHAPDVAAFWRAAIRAWSPDAIRMGGGNPNARLDENL